MVQYPRLGRAEREFKSRQPHMKVKSLSRRVERNDGRLTKVYDSTLPALILDLSRAILSVIALKPRVDFISVKKRITNELLARRKIKGMKLSTIIEYSDNFLVEKAINGIGAGKFLKTARNEKIPYEIGRFIGRLHKKNMALIDNRPQNYIINKNKIFRVDLEMFKLRAHEFDKMCDLVSFVEYFDDKVVRSAFMKGHDDFCKCSYRSYVGFLSKIFLKTVDYLE